MAGLPPLVPDPTEFICLKHATTGGSAYEAGSSHVMQLPDGREVTVYERRGGLPQKGAAVATIRSGTRDVDGQLWTWATLDNGVTTLVATIRATYVELSMHGDESGVADMARIAATLRPVDTWPRPSARNVCGALTMFGSSVSVAGAFDSTAAAIANWEETPAEPGGPHVVISDWRKAPANETVTMCYLDGDFGPPRGPAPPPGASGNSPPNWDRMVVLVGVDRRPIPVVHGWQGSIPIKDPGR